MGQHAQPQTYKLEGVFARGYGVVPKSVLLLPGLSPEAKALYAYYCVLSGNGGGFQPSPGEEAVLRAMNISHTRFLKHRKALIDGGLICFEQGRRSAGGKQLFETARFLIVKAPETVLACVKGSGSLAKGTGKEAPSFSEQGDMPLNALAAMQEGVFSEGFGLTPRLVMQDPALSIEAKAAYAFLCVFANASTRGERSASPSATLLADRLMTRKRAQNAMRELIEAGYIRRERLHTGVYAGNCYILNFYKQQSQNEPAESAPQQSLFDTAEIQPDKPPFFQVSFEETSSPAPLPAPQVQEARFDTTKPLCPPSLFETAEFETAENQPAENETAPLYNTRGPNTTPVNNPSVRPPRASRQRNGRTDELISPALDVLNHGLEGTLASAELCRQEAALQIEADVLSQEFGEDIITAIVEILVDAYCATSGDLRINGRAYPVSMVAARFRKLRACHVEHVLQRIQAEDGGQIVNLQAYLTACLYNAPVSYGVENFHTRGFL